MHMVRQLNPQVYVRARQKQAELWDRIIAMVGGEWERGWSPSWTVHPVLRVDEVMEDLNYGRE